MSEQDCWHLIGKSGALKYKKFTLNGPKIVIGRTEDNDIIIPEHAVSRNHAQLEFKDNALWLTDLKSKNGTYINQQKISTQQIKGQDHVQIGDAKAIFKYIKKDPTRPAPMLGSFSIWIRQKNNRLLAASILFALPIVIQILFLNPRPQKAVVSQKSAPTSDINLDTDKSNSQNDSPKKNTSFTPPPVSTSRIPEDIPKSVISQTPPATENNNPPVTNTAAQPSAQLSSLEQNLTSALSLEDFPAAFKILNQLVALDPSEKNKAQLSSVEKTLRSKIAQYEDNALREYEKLNYDKAITEWQKALSLAQGLGEDLNRKIQAQIKEAQEKFSGK